MPEERIQKVLATAGVASRRAAEVLVKTGRVRVDGKVATVGQKVDPLTSTIELDGNPVGVGTARAYVALHKPAGVTSTTRDRHADTTVLDLIPTALVPDGTRLYPVGRLDQDSEGLLLLTNDGEWAERVLHPRFGVEREYAVALAAPLTAEQAQLLNVGIRIDEGLAKLTAPLRATTSVENRGLADALDPPPDQGYIWYRATLAQGWKRQLRRMFGAVEAPIQRLVRVRIGTVRLGDLRSGRARILKAPEVKSLAVLGGQGAARAGGGARPAGQGTVASVSPPAHRPIGRRVGGWDLGSAPLGSAPLGSAPPPISAANRHAVGDASGSIKSRRTAGQGAGETGRSGPGPGSSGPGPGSSGPRVARRTDYPTRITGRNANPRRTGAADERGEPAGPAQPRRTASEGRPRRSAGDGRPRPPTDQHRTRNSRHRET